MGHFMCVYLVAYEMPQEKALHTDQPERMPNEDTIGAGMGIVGKASFSR